MCAPFYYTHIFSGLETNLFIAGIVVILFLICEYLQNKEHNNLQTNLVFVSLFMLPLIRPEGIVLTILSVILIVNQDISENKKLTTKLMKQLFLILILPLSAFYLWRWNYYGYPLPNTFYVKATLPEFSEQSLNNFKQFLSEYILLPFICGILLVLIDVDQIWYRIKNQKNISQGNILIVMISLLLSIIF